MGQTLGVVDVLTSSKASMHGLTKQLGHPVNAAGTCATVYQRRARQIGQSEGVVQFPNEQQTAVRTELRPPELQPHPPVKFQPQIVPTPRTRWVTHETLPSRRPSR